MASELNTPPVLLKPFADSGDKNTIPETATGTQQASLDEGFPPVTSLPLTQGGIPPERKDFNGLGNLLSKQYFYLQNGGRFTFNQDVSDAIGGYPQNATLWFKDEALGISYPVISLINNNTYNFVTTPSYIDGVKWKRVIDSFPSNEITNCITEISQDIKLELNNGILTLKSGSKIYVPNGSGVFDTVTIASDLSNVSFAGGAFVITNGTAVLGSNKISSGSTAPENPVNGQIWYDTTNNIVKRYSTSSSSWVGGFSLPVSKLDGTGGIEQVFNGFGYIGSTVFALPGVKGLIPNGRNADGTLKNIEFELTSVSTRTESSYNANTDLAFSSAGGIAINIFSYNSWENLMYDRNGNATSRCVFGKIVFNSSSPYNITSLTPKTPFHAVDYNDFSDLSDKVSANTAAIATKQDTLVSGTNIKTINSTSVLGSGNFALADQSLSNLSADGQMIVDSQNGTISNCILDIPQNIKCEIANGKVVLKAGSIIVNQGATYNTITIDNDVEFNGQVNLNGDGLMFYNSNRLTYGFLPIERIHSGNTQPTGLSGNTHLWFNTDEKKFYGTTDAGANWNIFDYCSYPICAVHKESGNIINFLKDSNGNDMIFNGAGFIGSALYCFPNVKGLIPNGLNADGTYNSILMSSNGVRITQLSAFTGNRILLSNVLGGLGVLYDLTLTLGGYNPKTNLIYRGSGTSITGQVEVGSISMSDGIISDFTIRQPVRLATTEMLENYSTTEEVNSALALKQDTATAVNYDNISNCITEIPQDINLTLSSGTLTLKAGSKVYIPNGFESDGTTPKFDVVTIASDTIKTESNSNNHTWLLFYKNGSVYHSDINYCYSDSIAPTGQQYMCWYDTTNNLVKRTTNSGSTWESGFSLPLCIDTSSNGAISSIDQVFNGAGYIGSTIFVLPGIRGLIPNGRNEDGTLKNIEAIQQTVNMRHFNTTSKDYALGIKNNDTIGYWTDLYWYYDEYKNYNYSRNSGEGYNIWEESIVGSFSTDSNSRIINFRLKTAFHAVDYNDAMLKSDWIKVSSTPPADADPDKFYYTAES